MGGTIKVSDRKGNRLTDELETVEETELLVKRYRSITSKLRSLDSSEENIDMEQKKLNRCYLRLPLATNIPYVKPKKFRYLKDISEDGLHPKPESCVNWREILEMLSINF